MTAARLRRLLRLVLAGPAAVLLVVLPLTPTSPAVAASSAIGPWQLVDWRSVPAAHADQGVATVALPHGGQRVVTRGNADVADGAEDQGWWHVGDPGSAGGYLLDVFQGPPWMHAKLFVLTSPDGQRSQWRHTLAPGESINNSFAALAPSGRWFLSGEWGTMSRFLEYPTPLLNPLARPGRNLPLVAPIRLSRPVRDVQGCSFASAIQLVCATSDPGRDLFGVPRQLLTVTLTHPLDGRPQLGVPRLLGTVPQMSWCGISETEGIDVHGGRLLLLARERGWCASRSILFTYRLRV